MRDYSPVDEEQAQARYGRPTGVLVKKMIDIVADLTPEQIRQLAKTAAPAEDAEELWQDLQVLFLTEPAKVYVGNIRRDLIAAMPTGLWGYSEYSQPVIALHQALGAVFFSIFTGRESMEVLLRPWREADIPLPEELAIDLAV